jgi:hypothetical protein
MSIREDGGVKSWIERAEAAKIPVPKELTMEAECDLLKQTGDDPHQQHIAAHLIFHTTTARLCERGAQEEAATKAWKVAQAAKEAQQGQDDPKSEQAAQ